MDSILTKWRGRQGGMHFPELASSNKILEGVWISKHVKDFETWNSYISARSSCHLSLDSPVASQYPTITMADRHPPQRPEDGDDDAMFDADEAEEVIEQDEDAAMDSGDEDDEIQQEIQLQNDSVAHFDHHKDSIFCIAQHPTQPNLIASGGGDDIAYLWDCTPPEKPLLPRSYESDPGHPQERKGQDILAKLEGHDESVNAISFTLPKGDFVVTGTLAGRLGVYSIAQSTLGKEVASAKEVEEINWIAPCPNAAYPNTIAFGANDGSVWIYTINPSDPSSPLTIVQTFFLHQTPCTAGAWTPDGKLLATVAEDGSFYVWDAFGDAAAAGIVNPQGGSSQAVVGLTAEDERFRVDGGLYSIAISPGGGIAAVGGAEGHIRVVGLPRLGAAAAAGGARGGGAKSKAGGGKQAAAPSAASAGQAGQIMASLQVQSDGVETLDFSQPPLTLLAAGSVDGSIALFDAGHNFALRRHIKNAHGEGVQPQVSPENEAQEAEEPSQDEAVIQVSFLKTPLGTPNPNGHILTSCGNDGVVKRWDVRGSAAGTQGLVKEWKGHRGGGEGGGVLGFVQGGFEGNRVVTGGDDGVGLVFDM